MFGAIALCFAPFVLFVRKQIVKAIQEQSRQPEAPVGQYTTPPPPPEPPKSEAPPHPPPPSTGQADVSDRWGKLTELKEKGLITEEEFQVKKEELLKEL